MDEIDVNATRERPRSDQRPRRVLSRDEIAALLLSAEPRYQLPLALAVRRASVWASYWDFCGTTWISGRDS